MRELVRNLDMRYPGIANQLMDGGDIKASIAVSIDGDIAAGGVLDTVYPDSEVHFLPALGGG